jgi:hypothetical protein
MKITKHMNEFERDNMEGVNKEFYEVIMIVWQTEWDLNLKNLNEGNWPTKSLETLLLLQGFKDGTGMMHDKQSVLDALNGRLGN